MTPAPLETTLSRAFYGIALMFAALVGICALGSCSQQTPTAPVVQTHATPKPQAVVNKAVVSKPDIPTVTAYNGLLYAEMGPLVDALMKRGDRVKLEWHDEAKTDTSCPEYIIGHSMGGNAAIAQAEKCQAAGRAPKAIVVIDAGRCPGNSPCDVPANAKYECISYYDPSHPIGGQKIGGKCTNHTVSGYTHLEMPGVPVIDRGVFATIPPETK